jgi:hypothetical protein
MRRAQALSIAVSGILVAFDREANAALAPLLDEGGFTGEIQAGYAASLLEDPHHVGVGGVAGGWTDGEGQESGVPPRDFLSLPHSGRDLYPEYSDSESAKRITTSQGVER